MRRGSAQQKICMIEDSRQVNKLSSDATVSCGKCGARAHDPANLCDPVQMSRSGSFRK